MSENPAGFPEVAMLDDLEESVGRILDIPITKHDAMSPSQAVLPAPPSKVSTQSVSPLPAQSTAAAPVTLSNAPVDPPASTIALQASTARRITRQVTQQLSENSTAQGTRSEESIIASFNPSVSEAELSVAAAPPSTPTPKAKGRGKEKENALASSSKTASPRKSTTSKSDDANTVARLAAISARVEGINQDLTDELEGLRAQVTGIATEVAESIATSNSRLTNVITSNNQVAHAVTALRTQAAAMMDELRERRNQEAELRQSLQILSQQVQTLVDAANSTNHADLVPALTRARTSLEPSSTLVSAPPASTVDPWATTLQANTVASAVPGAVAAPAPLPMSAQGPATATSTPPFTFHAPAAAPSYPAAPAPTSSTHHAGGNGLVRAPQPHRPSNGRSSGAQVLIGPMAWSTDITGQARTILVNTPGCQHLHWKVIARAARAGPNYVIAIFQEDQGDAAVQFVNSFAAAVEYYPTTTVSLLQGNA